MVNEVCVVCYRFPLRRVHNVPFLVSLTVLFSLFPLSIRSVFFFVTLRCTFLLPLFDLPIVSIVCPVSIVDTCLLTMSHYLSSHLRRLFFWQISGIWNWVRNLSLSSESSSKPLKFLNSTANQSETAARLCHWTSFTPVGQPLDPLSQGSV